MKQFERFKCVYNKQTEQNGTSHVQRIAGEQETHSELAKKNTQLPSIKGAQIALKVDPSEKKQ